MKKTIVIFLLLANTLLFACTNTPPDMSAGETIYNKESVTTETSTEPEKDSFKNVRESKEVWLSYGLSAYEAHKKPTDLKEFFSNGANMVYLTLYDHMFTFDKAASIPVAEALFTFIYDKYGSEALLDIEKRCEYKTDYLHSLGLEIQYAQTAEVETFFTEMKFSSNKTYQYIFSFDNATYYFKDFGVGSPSQYHAFLYYSTTGLSEMIGYMRDNNLSQGLAINRQFNFYMTFDGSGYSKTLANGNMYINESYSTLHEAVHALGIATKDNIWLSEGICNYFGRSLGFNDQIAASHIQILTMIKQGYFDDLINQGDQSAIQKKAVYDNYINRGGKIDSVETFDFRLYSDVTAKVELDFGSYITLGNAYKTVNKTECNAVGNEISYEQATSLIIYLVDTYGIEKVMEAYQTQNIEAVFGKDYESLKSEWLDYLK
ncbi:MAG: hypothetical protein IJY39_03325 [Clostridia bacterium]|nr:hypothetical protein [Clostridia bacterium]